MFLYDETVDEDKKSICGIYTISIIDNKIIILKVNEIGDYQFPFMNFSFNLYEPSSYFNLEQRKKINGRLDKKDYYTSDLINWYISENNESNEYIKEDGFPKVYKTTPNKLVNLF